MNRKQLKRVITKSGEIRYYKNGKRLKNKTGQRSWVKQNQNSDPGKFSKNELRSFNALKRYNDGWKFKGISVQSVYVDLLRLLKVPINKAINKDLSTIKNANGQPLFKNFSDILKRIDQKAKADKTFLRFCTEKGLPGYRNRDFDTFKDNTIRSIVDFIDLLQTESFKNYKLRVIDPQGDEHQGRVKGILALRDFEIFVGEKIQNAADNSAFLKFCYDYKIDFKERVLIVDLTDINPYKEVEDYVNETNSKQGDTLIIKGKYRDCIIEVMFS